MILTKKERARLSAEVLALVDEEVQCLIDELRAEAINALKSKLGKGGKPQLKGVANWTF